MTVLRMQESQFGAPVGLYEARFLGVKDLPDDGKPRLGHDGRPMPPGMEWQWEITQGEHTGQIVSRITSKTPTRKNSCGALLLGILGREIKLYEAVDLSLLIDVACQVVVSRSKDNPNRTQVTEVLRKKPAGQSAPPTVLAGPANSQAPSSPQIQAAADQLLDKANDRREAQATFPPSLQPTQPTPPGFPAAVARPELRASFSVLWPDAPAPQQATGEEVTLGLKLRVLDPRNVMVKPLAGGDWKSAADYGLGDPF
jgi:hypothetical protein